MRIFVTGGTGFIGSHFLNAVIADGHVVYALRHQNAVSRIPLKKEPIWIDGDLDSDLRRAFSACDAVVHLAAHSPNSPYDMLERCLYWNLSASLALFQ